MLDQANADLKRYSALTPDIVVSKQKLEQVVAVQGAAKAAFDQASADQSLAKLNLDRSEVRASVNGVVSMDTSRRRSCRASMLAIPWTSS